MTRLFNPRTDYWGDHFTLQGLLIQSQTPIGEATVRILGLNGSERTLERQTLYQIGRYPPQAASRLLSRKDRKIDFLNP